MPRLKPLPVILACAALFGGCSEEIPDDAALDDEQTLRVMTPHGPIDWHYEFVGGLAIAEGDIVIATQEEVETLDPVFRGFGVFAAGRLWPEATVPFTFDAALGSMRRNAATNAMNDWEAATRIRFVPRTTEADFVTFVPGGAAFTGSSALGHQTGEQFITLGWGAGSGLITHEIGHALGLFHEHTRPDRDLYIDVDLSCVKVGREFNFAITNGQRPREPYDYDSLMHYSSKTFCRRLATACLCKPIAKLDGTLIPSASVLSPGDTEAIGMMYGRRDFPSVSGIPGDRMGSALAYGDFDGDGFGDLAVGAPEVPRGSKWKTGAVHVYDGIDDTRRVSAWTILEEGWSSNGRFGAALATGDYNNDGFDDLAVGVPDADFSSAHPDVGMVMLYEGGSEYGLAIGITEAYLLGSAASPATGDEFGAALAFGDFDDDGDLELAIGAPGDEGAGDLNPGRVYIVDFPAPDQVALGGVLDVSAFEAEGDGDEFGRSLAAGQIDGLPGDELAIGAPGKEVLTLSTGLPTLVRAGGVYVFKGASGGPTPLGRVDQSGLDVNETGDRFGEALAVGDLSGTTTSELVVGAPGKSIGGLPRAGRIYGFTSAGLTPAFAIDQTLALTEDPLGPEAFDEFGAAVAVSGIGGAGIIVGAPGEDLTGARGGAVFAFQTYAGTWAAMTSWTQAPFGADDLSDGFGSAVAAGEIGSSLLSSIAIGAPGAEVLDATTTPPVSDVGVAYIVGDPLGSGGPLEVLNYAYR